MRVNTVLNDNETAAPQSLFDTFLSLCDVEAVERRSDRDGSGMAASHPHQHPAPGSRSTGLIACPIAALRSIADIAKKTRSSSYAAPAAATLLEPRPSKGGRSMPDCPPASPTLTHRCRPLTALFDRADVVIEHHRRDRAFHSRPATVHVESTSLEWCSSSPLHQRRRLRPAITPTRRHTTHPEQRRTDGFARGRRS